jgi:hypothetical protein
VDNRWTKTPYEGRLTGADMVAMLDERMHVLPQYRQQVVPARRLGSSGGRAGGSW